MADPLDRPSPVREGQGFDVAALATWLRTRIDGLEGEPELLAVRPWLLEPDVPRALRRIASSSCGARRRASTSRARTTWGASFGSCRALRSDVVQGAAAPRPLRRRRPSSARRSTSWSGCAASSCARRCPRASCSTRPRCARASEATCDTLAEIHSLDWNAVGPRGPRQARGLRRAPGARLGRALREGADRRRPAGRRASARGSRSTGPRESGATLVHNDFKYDNVVLAPDLSARRRGARLGDGDHRRSAHGPGHGARLLDRAGRPAGLPGDGVRPDQPPREPHARRARGALVAGTGRDASNVLFYYAFALFKLAVVAQQLYKRWVDGLTKEERYAMMLEGVRAVASSALVADRQGAHRPPWSLSPATGCCRRT